MLNILLKSLKIFGIVIVIIIIGLFIIAKLAGNNANEYYKHTKTNGVLESKYTKLGSFDFEKTEFKSESDVVGKYVIHYPKQLKESNEKFPVVIFANGTGGTSKDFVPFFNHLASWGFIAIGNDDQNTRTGLSTNDTIKFIMEKNSDTESIFYNKVDLENIGVGGHSQGGVAVFNSITKQELGSMIKVGYAVSATSSKISEGFMDGWEYDLTNINVPMFLTAGTGMFDAGTATSKDQDNDEKNGILQGITPLWSLEENFSNLSNVDKVIARKVDVDHGNSHHEFDGYMTAWFRYYLMGDEEAGKVFYGENPEILSNSLYQDVKIEKAK